MVSRLHATNQVLDVFSGCGGFSLGAHEAGFRSALAIDIDPKLTASFMLNFPQSALMLADAGKIEAAEIRAKVGPQRLAGIIGGPPCQGFSVIGKRHPGDPRNALVMHFFRLVSELRPRFFVMENVPGIVAGSTAATLETALQHVADQYNIVGPLAIDAVDFGAATRRPRIVVIGYDVAEVDRLTEADVAAASLPRTSTVRNAIADLSGPADADPTWDEYDWRAYAASPTEGPEGDYVRRARRLPADGLGSHLAIEKLRLGLTSGYQPTVHSKEVVARFDRLQPGSRDPVSKFTRLKWDAPCIALRAGTGADKGSFQSVRPIHPNESRVITVREAARIQGFPDWFLFHPAKWHSFRMIGNSVSPCMSAAIMRLLALRSIKRRRAPEAGAAA